MLLLLLLLLLLLGLLCTLLLLSPHLHLLLLLLLLHVGRHSTLSVDPHMHVGSASWGSGLCVQLCNVIFLVRPSVRRLLLR